MRTVGHFNIEENPWSLNSFFYGCLSFCFTSVHPLKPPLCDRRPGIDLEERERGRGRITNQSTSGSDPYNPSYIDIPQVGNSAKSSTLCGEIDQGRSLVHCSLSVGMPMSRSMHFWSFFEALFGLCVCPRNPTPTEDLASSCLCCALLRFHIFCFPLPLLLLLPLLLNINLFCFPSHWSPVPFPPSCLPSS